MNDKLKGNILFIAMLSMMATLTAEDIKRLMGWNEVFTPAFIGGIAGHFGAVVGAYLSGRLTPENRNNKFTRAYDI